MRAYRISLPAVAILLAISVWPPVAEARPGASQCGPVPSPSPGEFANYLRGVSAASADDVWAVGYQRHTAFDSSRTLIEHWNGASWEAIAGQDHGDGHNILYSVAAISPTDA